MVGDQIGDWLVTAADRRPGCTLTLILTFKFSKAVSPGFRGGCILPSAAPPTHPLLDIRFSNSTRETVQVTCSWKH